MNTKGKPRGKPFTKGNNGRPKGSKNRFSKSVKDTVLNAFIELQEDDKANIVDWGRTNPTEFYKIAAKLIPTDLKAELSTGDKPLEIKSLVEIIHTKK